MFLRFYLFIVVSNQRTVENVCWKMIAMRKISKKI